MFSKWLVALIPFVIPTLSAPSPLIAVGKTKNAIPGRYIITFKNNTGNFAGVPSIASVLSSDSNITHQWDVISGFAGSFTDTDVELLRSHPNIMSIEQDGYAQTQTVATQ